MTILSVSGNTSQGGGGVFQNHFAPRIVVGCAAAPYNDAAGVTCDIADPGDFTGIAAAVAAANAFTTGGNPIDIWIRPGVYNFDTVTSPGLITIGPRVFIRGAGKFSTIFLTGNVNITNLKIFVVQSGDGCIRDCQFRVDASALTVGTSRSIIDLDTIGGDIFDNYDISSCKFVCTGVNRPQNPFRCFVDLTTALPGPETLAGVIIVQTCSFYMPQPIIDPANIGAAICALRSLYNGVCEIKMLVHTIMNNHFQSDAAHLADQGRWEDYGSVVATDGAAGFAYGGSALASMFTNSKVFFQNPSPLPIPFTRRGFAMNGLLTSLPAEDGTQLIGCLVQGKQRQDIGYTFADVNGFIVNGCRIDDSATGEGIRTNAACTHGTIVGNSFYRAITPTAIALDAGGVLRHIVDHNMIA